MEVSDAIEMRQLADPEYTAGGPSEGRVANFSPDGKRFVVALRKGNLETNVNEFSLLLFESSKVFSTPAPDVLFTMASSSNRNAIKHLRWLDDNETLAFIGETRGSIPQIYTFSTRTRRLQQRTHHATGINGYDITGDGREIVFIADPPPSGAVEDTRIQRQGILIEGQNLPNLMAGTYHQQPSEAQQLFLLKRGRTAVQIPTADSITGDAPVSLSKDGRYALIGTYVRSVPISWMSYTDSLIRRFVAESHQHKRDSNLARYLLLDCWSGSARPVLDTPMLIFNPFQWGVNDRTIYLKGVYLPLDGSVPVEDQARSSQTFDVELTLASGEMRKVREAEWPPQTSLNTDLDVTLDENLNISPKIYVASQTHPLKTLLYDLNPEFTHLNFGEVRTAKFRTADGRDLTVGLYLPPGHTSAKRYPLVIQTHGFRADRFLIDGPWPTAFSAQALAARGMIVAQVPDPPYEARATARELEMAVSDYDGLVDDLDREGLIDPGNVGIVGFSRTCLYVKYLLTHSKRQIQAVVVADGVDAGYFQYLAFPGLIEYDAEQVIGAEPFGDGLSIWLARSPGFQLDKVRSPVLIQAIGPSSLLGEWEWFSGLSRLGKPVGMIYLPGGTHRLEKACDRFVSQQVTVDWFCFWLNGEEDPDPAKADQYARWRELHKLQRAGGTGPSPK